MVLMSAGKKARSQSVIINRGIESGGSIGGMKKAGTANLGYWKTGNAPLPRRFPGCICNESKEFYMRVTTRHPLQRNRNNMNVGRGHM